MARPALFLILLALGACTAGLRGPAGTEPVSAAYSVGGGSFNSGGALITMVRVREQGGQTVLCGARTHTRLSAIAIGLAHPVAGAGIVRLAGRNLVQGLEIFPEHALRDDMTGVTARCYATGLAWQPGFADLAPEIHHVRMQWDEEEDGVLDVFRETTVPDVIRRP